MTAGTKSRGPNPSWLALYDRALRQPHAAGYYNRNVPAEVDGRKVIVRIPIPGAPDMDLRVLPEADVLRAAAEIGLRVPQVLHQSQAPAFSVHEFVEGELVNDCAPRGTALPGHIISDIANAIVTLHGIGRERIPTLPTSWPRDGDSTGCAARLMSHTQAIFDSARAEFATIYRALGVPANPLAEVAGPLSKLKPRPFHLLHADLHRKNLIAEGGKTWILDWELALWGDPLYEVAVHLHKMKYLPSERQAFLDALSHSAAGRLLDGFESDLEVLLLHERAKSVIVDTVRYTSELRGHGVDPSRAESLCASLADKLSDVEPVWRNPILTADEIRDVVTATDARKDQ